ncbi:MAG TPA: quinolinate synthase NadA, partial [Bacteroidota bacterium]|nr:quinolinate synthase NadA [Bacteroidota bacterium]
VLNSSRRQFIVATEPGILHQMKLQAPTKEFIAAPPEANCACNECPYMKLNTLEKLYRCMADRSPEVTLSAEIMEKARRPIERMLAMS